MGEHINITIVWKATTLDRNGSGWDSPDNEPAMAPLLVRGARLQAPHRQSGGRSTQGSQTTMTHRKRYYFLLLFMPALA
jgi:hypothetical protein